MLSVTIPESLHHNNKKTVSWKGIFVREFNCTVGDHPMCSDNLPLSLDWSHSDDLKVRPIESSRERKANYKFPKRLSYEDRARRIFGNDLGIAMDASSSDPAIHNADVLQASQGVQESMMDLDEALEHDNIEVDASEGVIYCRHAHDEKDDEDEEGDFISDFFRLANL